MVPQKVLHFLTCPTAIFRYLEAVSEAASCGEGHKVCVAPAIGGLLHDLVEGEKVAFIFLDDFLDLLLLECSPYLDRLVLFPWGCPLAFGRLLRRGGLLELMRGDKANRSTSFLQDAGWTRFVGLFEGKYLLSESPIFLF